MPKLEGQDVSLLPGGPHPEPRRAIRRPAGIRLPTNMLLLPALVVTLVVGAVVSPSFLTESNILQNIGGNSAPLALVSFGEMLILITGNFDLSLQSTVGFAPMVAALLMSPVSTGGTGFGLNPYLAIMLTLLLGAAIGAVNAVMVVKLGLNAFMVTLAMLIVLSGLDLGLSNGETMSPLPGPYVYLGNADWLGIPVSVWVVVALGLILGGVLKHHQLGRAVYAIGGNSDAARTAGIRVDAIRSGTFIIGGMFAALGGIAIAGITSAVTSSQGNNMIFSVFAAVVIGGVSLQGGRGSVLGVISGVLLLGMITNVLTLSQISAFWIDACYGLVILLALMIGRLAGRASSSAN